MDFVNSMRIALVITIIASACLGTFQSLRYVFLRYEELNDYAKVTDKKFKKAYKIATFHYIGKSMVPYSTHHAEQNFVYVEYNDRTYHINDKKIYQSVKVGDSLLVHVRQGYNKKGVLKHTELSVTTNSNSKPVSK